MPRNSLLKSKPEPDTYWVETPRDEGIIRQLSFHDERAPEQVVARLERQLMSVFEPQDSTDRLTYHLSAKINGSPLIVDLGFDAAFPNRNRYNLRIDTSWTGSSPTHLDYLRNSARGWFRLWTEDFAAHVTYSKDAGSQELYHGRRLKALAAEAELASVERIQSRILQGLRAGGEFSTSHKEGGTRMLLRGDRFVYSSYGESQDVRVFESDAEFLRFLRQYFEWETSRNVAPAKLPDPLAWRLILRLLRARDDG